jgi:membrane fusion protein (multidrug efflux system)
MKPVKPFAAAAAATFVLLAAGCKREAGGPSRSESADAIAVTVATVTNVAWDKTVSIIGTLYPKDEATLAAQVEGAVERTLVDFGDRVRDNQDLAFIDTASYEAQVEQAVGNLAKAEANLANARQSFDRVQTLRKDGIASESDFDQAKAQLDQWEAELKAARGVESVARLNLQRSRVQAPFEGAISQRIVGRGDYVKTGSPLFNIVNDAVLKFIFQVPERYGSSVQKGLPVSFGVDNYPAETWTGTVYLISPAVTMSSRAFNVGALVTNTNFRLKANTFARGSVVLERGAPTPVVPLESVVNFAGVTKVFVLENNVARSRSVQAGRIRDGLQEVVHGVKVGELVVVTGQTRLTDGAAVVIQTTEAPEPAHAAATGSSSDKPAVAARHESH